MSVAIIWTTLYFTDQRGVTIRSHISATAHRNDVSNFDFIYLFIVICSDGYIRRNVILQINIAPLAIASKWIC